MKREIPLLLTFVFGAFIVLSNFIVWQPWKTAAESVNNWALIVIAFTTVLGVGNVFRLHGLTIARLAAAGREVSNERRAIDRLHPAAQLAQARERAGGLLDRASAAIGRRLAADRSAHLGASGRLGPIVADRLRRGKRNATLEVA